MKVMCITECSYSMGSTNHQFNIGDQYQLSDLQPVEEDRIMYINLVDNSNSIITVLKSDFVTVEQWREQQIDKIIG